MLSGYPNDESSGSRAIGAIAGFAMALALLKRLNITDTLHSGSP